jgi:hypothetical protein
MTETIIAATEYGMSNNEIVPLIYFQTKSDLKVDPFNNEPFFKKGFRFVIASVPSALLFIFKSSKQDLQLQVDRKNIVGFEKLGYQTFEAKKTSSAAARLQRAAAVTGSGGLIPILAVQGISKWLQGNKSEQHEGQVFKLNYEYEGEKKFITVACEKSYEDDFTIFLTSHWTNNLLVSH